MDNFFDHAPKELQAVVEKMGAKSYRARQLYQWVYQRGVLDFHSMDNLPKALRSALADEFSFVLPDVNEIVHSEDGSIKFGLLMNTGHLVETVLMPEKGRNTLCVSTQIGCKMACQFCVTGHIGFLRNLSAAEIIGQVMAVKRYAHNRRITNIVFMGMGEPLDNLENLLTALEIIQEPAGLDFSYRRVTVSTVGLLDGLRSIVPRKAQIAISLNASCEAGRSELMPINRIYPLRDIVAYVRSLKNMGRQRVTFEYVLIKGINDSPDDARALAELLAGVRCKINLIPYNASPRTEFQTPDEEAVGRFHKILLDRNFTALVRDSHAKDIGGGCGQLGMKYLEEKG
ncbi:MAG TPA: 23S rRNA (adenine(2503)-C(2))-methyltransferase RlmN [Syntrophorhabdales bacterium]|nr:23S rRNA (adenine(2503)-C(2))-methyltransferase RlmN [Syntrophorhabdales bacterium]